MKENSRRSEDIRNKVTAKHSQCKGYKIISKELDVPVERSEAAAMSPDLNPAEHLWKELKPAAGRRQPSNLRELEQFDQEEAELPVKKSRNIIQSHRKSLTAVIASKG